MQLEPSDGPPSRGVVQLVSGDYFGALRQTPQRGRLLGPSDNETVGAHPVAVVSDGYWRKRLNGAAEVIGMHLLVNGAPFTIVGVSAPAFFGTTLALHSPDVWIPFVMQATVHYAANASSSGSAKQQEPWSPQPQIEWLNVFARVPAGSASQAAMAMTAVYIRDRTAAIDSDATAEDRAALQKGRVTLDDASTGVSGLRNTLAQPLFVLLAMVGILLAIACGNVAGLLVARAASREREMAIRLSIGAGRGRLIRQLLAEALLLSAGGAAVGLTCAVWARDALLNLFVSTSSPVDLNTGLDRRVLLFSVAIAIVTGLACGLLPALRATRVSVAESLKHSARAVTGEGRRGLLVGKALVGAQMAFCLLLLVVAGLFGRSLRSLVRTDVGFDRDHLLTARVDVRGAGYGDAERQALSRRIVERLERVPGIVSVSLSANGPLANSARISSMTVEGQPADAAEGLRTNEETVTQEYFETVGLRLIAGRKFGPDDRAPGSKNTIVNATMARRFFPNQSAIGKRWSFGGAIDKDANVIVGVVEDARYLDVRTTSPNMAYFPAEAVPDDVLGDIEIRTAGSPSSLVRTVHDLLVASEPRLPVVEVVPLADRIDRDVSQDRMVARLTTLFGALALLLASLGLYGTISYGINRRVGELGLRMALGARRGDVLWMVMREALTLVALGGAIGIPLAALAARGVRTALYGVGASDPASFAIGGATLLVIASLAAYLPAYRASRIEPMVALGR